MQEANVLEQKIHGYRPYHNNTIVTKNKSKALDAITTFVRDDIAKARIDTDSLLSDTREVTVVRIRYRKYITANVYCPPSFKAANNMDWIAYVAK